jgi:hypothetical protein
MGGRIRRPRRPLGHGGRRGRQFPDQGEARAGAWAIPRDRRTEVSAAAAAAAAAAAQGDPEDGAAAAGVGERALPLLLAWLLRLPRREGGSDHWT